MTHRGCFSFRLEVEITGTSVTAPVDLSFMVSRSMDTARVLKSIRWGQKIAYKRLTLSLCERFIIENPYGEGSL